MAANEQLRQLIDKIPSIYENANRAINHEGTPLQGEVINPEDASKGSLEKDLLDFANKTVREAAMAEFIANDKEFFQRC